MTPADFVNDIVVPTVREFRDVRRSRRRAYLACIIVFHIKDHLRKAGAKQIEDTIRKATGDGFDAVRAVCNGTKHVVTNQSLLTRLSRATTGTVRRPRRVVNGK
jgi:hypothetical protein